MVRLGCTHSSKTTFLVSNELIINATTAEGGRIALLENRNLVELHFDKVDDQFTVGDIYLGTIRKVLPGLNAAFVDIGYEKDGFLHYLDLGPQVRSLLKYIKYVQNRKNNGSAFKLGGFNLEDDINKLGKINEVLKPNQKILVQVVKEPISTKGPRLSCELSLAGRFLVLVPFSNAINISKKIADSQERKRLQRLITSIKPENFGVIIRTVAEGKEVAELDRDLRDLTARWQKGIQKLAVAKPRQKIVGEINRASSMLRDMLNESFDSITVDDKDTFEEIRQFISTIAPGREEIVRHYHGRAKIFESFGIEKQMKMLFGQTVSLPSGGYLVIEHTEALHVIDVNSGNKSSKEKSQEDTAVKVNIEAASEVARQLRLRDMGGIIVIDFIDMRKTEHKRQVYEHMRQVMKSDRSRYTVLPLSKFGLMQITRQRVRPELTITTQEACPQCNGTGKLTATIAIEDQIEQHVEYILAKQNERNVTLILHPYLHSHFTKGWYSQQWKWYFKYQKWLKLLEDSSLGISEYYFRNKEDELIELSQPS